MNLDQNQVVRTHNPDLEGLIKLSELDKIIGQLTDVIQCEIPGHIKALEDDFVRDQTKLRKFDEEMAALTKRKKSLEAEVDDTKSKIAKANQKLPEVKTNVEYRAIMKETENFKQRITTIEDEQLALMEKMEDKEGERPAIEKQVAEDKAKLDKLKAEKTVELNSYNESLDKANAERASIIGAINPAILATYDKVRAQRAGTGLARVKDGSCMACFQIITPQLYYQIRTTDEIYRCPHCDRFLYHVPEPKPDNGEPAKGKRKKQE
ncbi:MAG: C4-type zinc ribbon domain-containing protein [Nitrospinota bacterium]|nr:C4-type zinc ribbon domain-containing protein [Nitrospinota bacterium]